MRRRGYPAKRRIGTILVGIGATMLIALLIPFWVWWFFFAVAFLAGGMGLLRK